MEGGCNDPYEQQLLAVFESCLVEGQTGLDEEGLRSLCNKLELEERGKELISCLLERTPVRKTVSFYEFRDGLLALLGKSQEGVSNYSERQFANDSLQALNSSKLVLKKYGHRSISKDQKSDMDFQYENTDANLQLDEQRLRELWNKLNSGIDGNMDRSELYLVSHCIGIPTLPRQTIEHIFEKLDIDHDGQINLDDFFLLFRNGKTLSDQLGLGWRDGSLNDMIKQDSEKNNIQILGIHHTGYARSSTIVDMWEVAGVPDAATLLSDLGFTSPDVCLTELINVLCDELKSLRDQSDIRVMGTHISLLKATLVLYQEEVRSLNTLVEHLGGERDKLRVDIVEANERASLLAQEVDEHHVRLEKSSQYQLKQLESKHVEVTKDLTNQLSSEREANAAALKLMDQRLQTLQQEDQRIRTELTNTLQENQTLEMENQSLSNQISKLKVSNNQLQMQVQILAAEHDEVENVEARENEQVICLIDRIKGLQFEVALLRDQNDELRSELEILKERDCVTRENITSPNSLTKSSLSDKSEGQNNVFDSEVLGVQIAEHETFLKQSESTNSPIRYNGWKKDAESKDKKLSELNNLLGKIIKELTNISIEKNNCTLENCVFRSKVSEIIDRLELNSFLQSIVKEADSIKSLANELEVECEERASESLRDLVINRNDKLKLGKRMSSSDDTIQNIDKNFNNLDVKNVAKNKISLRDYPPRKEEHFIVEQPKVEKEKSSISYNLTQTSNDKFETNKLDVDKQENVKDVDSISELLREQEVKHANERKQMTERCVELERSLELLRTEYEQCEDYWTDKMEEERQLFEQEQKISDEKFSELIAKMAEYEEQFGTGYKGRNDGPLSTIEERFNLEQQYVDLEKEYEEWKTQAETDLLERDKEIKELREKLQNEKRPLTSDFSVQFPDEKSDFMCKAVSSSNHVVSSEVSFSDEINVTANPVSLPSSSQLLSKITQCDADTNKLIEPYSLSQITVPVSDLTLFQPIRTTTCPHGYNCHQVEAYSSAEELCKVHKDELRRLYQKKLNIDTECNSLLKQKEVLMQEVLKLQNIRAINCYCSQVDAGEQACRIDINVLQTLNARLQTQEQKCRHLQTSLKLQQQHTERILHQTWKQHRNEVTDLQFVLRNTQEKLQQQIQSYKEQADRLTRADLLAKDLYVENAYLMASVERLERRCHMLTQFSAESTSV